MREAQLRWSQSTVLLLLIILSLPSPAHARGLTLKGRVVDEDHRPLTGVRLSLLPEPSLRERIELFLATAQQPEVAPAAGEQPLGLSDAHGDFEVTIPQAGFYRLIARREGRLPQEVWLHPLVGDRELPPLVLPEPRRMTVRVLDPSGHPLAGAWVHVPPHQALKAPLRQQFPVWTRESLVRTDEKGEVTLGRSAESTTTVRAWAPTFGEVEESAGPRVTLRLKAGEVRAIVLHGEQQEVIAGALVLVGEGLFPAGTSDEAGRVQLAGALGQPLTLRAIPGDGVPRILQLPAHQEHPWMPMFVPSVVWLEGQIRDASNGRPLAGALVWIPGRDMRWASSDHEGGYRLPALPAPTRVRALADGFFPAQLNRRPVAGLFPSSSLALEPCVEVRGVVEDTRGRPVAGVEVTGFYRGRDPRRLSADLWRAVRDERIGHSDGAGRFLLRELLPKSPYELQGRHPSWAEGRTVVTTAAPGQPQSELRLVLEAGVSATGRVETVEGTPVGGAELTLTPVSATAPWRSRAEEPLATAITDGEGRFDLAHLATGTYELQVEAAGFSTVTVRGLEVAPPVADWGAVTLQAGARLVGRVVDSQGAGIAEVGIWSGEGGRGPRLDPYARIEEAAGTYSDATGAFELTDLPADQKVGLLFRKEGFAPKVELGLTPPLEEPLEVVLPGESAVRGRVTDQAGNPLEKVTVGLETGAERRGRAQVVEVQETGLDGVFDFRGLAAGTFALRATAESYQVTLMSDLEVRAQGTLEGIELVLEPGWAIRGGVLDADRVPVPGAGLRALPIGRGLRSAINTQSDGEGRFALLGLPSGSIEVLAIHRDHSDVRQRVELEGADREIEIVFSGGYPVSGTVLTTDGQPVHGAEVQLARPGTRWSDLAATSREDGTFVVEGVPPGSWNLSASAQGYARAIRPHPLEVRESPISGLEVRLSQGARIVGSIEGLTAEELRRVRVRAFLRSSVAPELREGVVAPEGSYRVPGLPPGTWLVQASLEGKVEMTSLTVEEGNDEYHHDFEFEEELTLSGVVIDASGPAAGMIVGVWSLERGRVGVATTDHQGRFSIHGVKEGRYTVQAGSAGEAPRYRREYEIRGDQEIEIRLDQGVRVAGFITDAEDDHPLGSLVVLLSRAQPDRHGITETRRKSSDSGGYFAFDEVQPGAWVILVRTSGYEPLDQPLTVVAGEAPPELHLEMAPQSAMRLHLWAPEGLLPSRVSISAFGADGGPVGATLWGPVDEEGWVELDGLPRAPCTVLLASPEHALVEVQVAPGLEPEIPLQRGALLTVRVPALQEDSTGAFLTLRSPTQGRVLRWPDHPQGVRHRLPLVLGSAQLTSVPAGSWTVVVQAVDGRVWTGEVQAVAGQSREVVLE